ncbi:SAM-dependent methyltransferase [Nitrosomonas sp.]|uniref:SAM-dependent methyltransferase n=1 Tax=Nitrosomonas sp. TaxID=42353 RepID=UPI001D3F38D6|nr:SAM-dependent methyltransferase [Nitrosomonas sp.]MCB1947595.1 SAM-dependent methyltransferase [Nitrosomonas sp.]
MTGKLFLIPTPLSQCDLDWIIPVAVRQSVQKLQFFIVEHPKTARRFLKQIECKSPIQDIHMEILNEHTPANELETLLQPLLAGHDVGLLSEAGCPAIADPGSNLVRLAHNKQIRIIPFTGPSSILLALMASGLNGQRFCFHGYLPIDNSARTQAITALEKISGKHDQTQIFIETPYRNQKLLELIIQICRDDTDLCIAACLTATNEIIDTKTVKEWKQELPDINKIPTIFLLQSKPLQVTT